MTHVVHIITRLDRGGSAENTLSSALGLAARGYRVTVLTGPGDDRPSNLLGRVEAAGIRVTILPALRREVRPARDLTAWGHLVRALRRDPPTIVHTHESKAGFLGRWAARLAGCQRLVHTPHGHIFYGHFSPTRTTFYAMLERITARITTRLVALTPREIEEHLARGVGRRDQWVAIHSGVPLERFQAVAPDPDGLRRELGCPSGAPLVGSVGRLAKVKRYQDLIAAVARLTRPDVACLLVGDGPEAPALAAAARQAGVGDRVRFLGWRDDIPRIVGALNVFVLPSANEGMGRVLVEAMAAGVPVIGTRVGGIPSVIADGECGLLVEAGDVAGLSGAIGKLLADGALAARMGAVGRRRALAYGVESMVEKLDGLYRELLA
ncbi:MAG: glycosyltransferase family 4 protein [candidate division NC10 bacterium]|nr:glycosyltransferase family 4 protein [candidate division NC10 bacterium]